MLRRGTVSTLRALAATAVLAFAAEHAGAQSAPLPVESIDVYGSDALDAAAIRAEFTPDIRVDLGVREHEEALYTVAVESGNAMRALLHMAQADKERDYPLDSLLAAWDFPATSDRNNAGPCRASGTSAPLSGRRGADLQRPQQ